MTKIRYLFLITAQLFLLACSKPEAGVSAYLADKGAAQAGETTTQASSLDLMKSVVRGDIVKVRQSIQAGADLNASISANQAAPITPLIAAIILGHETIIQELIHSGASTQIRHKGYALLEFARLKGNRFSDRTIKMLKDGQ